MTVTTPTAPRPATVAPADTARRVPRDGAPVDASVTLSRLVSAEWFKFRTVRGNLVAIVGAVTATVGFGTLFSWLADSDDRPGRAATDALSLSLAGADLAQLVIAILGVALVAGEYQTGLIRSWLAATQHRVGVLAAKTAVYSVVVFLAMGVAATVAFVAGQAVLPDTMVSLSLADDGVAQALLGTAFYSACIAAMGVSLGFILRSTAAGAGAVVTLLMLAPGLIGLLPSAFADPVSKVLPSNAGAAVTGVSRISTDLLSTGWGIVTLVVWVAVALAAAGVALQRRDA